MIKALFFDIDGTLVSITTHRIPQSTVDALTAAKAKGIEIYISTGRPYPLINNIGQIRHLVDGYITANGAYCFAGDDVVSCTTITAKGVSKAKGIREFSRYRGFDVAETMAFGDGGNDLAMIRAAGIGVAMANANPCLKEAADYVTTSVDADGIAHALRHFHVI